MAYKVVVNDLKVKGKIKSGGYFEKPPIDNVKVNDGSKEDPVNQREWQLLQHCASSYASLFHLGVN